jgi:hypothetical protein
MPWQGTQSGSPVGLPAGAAELGCDVSAKDKAMAASREIEFNIILLARLLAHAAAAGASGNRAGGLSHGFSALGVHRAKKLV